MTLTTCIPLSYLCGDFFLHLFSHGSRARAAATSPRSPQEDIRRGEEKGETSGEETTTSPSHLGSQCSTNIGALQHDQYHYNQCTSCDDISEDGDILATCLHLYDVDIKDGACYMLNLPQPRLPTPPSLTVHHQHSQSGHVNSGPTSTSVSSSTSTCSTSHAMRRNLLQQTSWYFSSSRSTSKCRDPTTSSSHTSTSS